MGTRLELQTLLEQLLESRQVYYQPPESIKMTYPAIRYTKSQFDVKHADNRKYLKTSCYDITVMDTRPDNPVIEKLLALPMSSFDRHYTVDNLNHDVIRLYF